MDEYELASPLYLLSAEQLRRSDRCRPQPVERWLAVESGEAVGSMRLIRRPDRRTFLDLRGRPSTYRLLIAAAGDDHPRLCVRVDESDIDARRALTDAGFVAELVEESFRLGFDRALSALRRASTPSGMTLVPAGEVDQDRLFTLDNTLRQDVPGTDGWRGDRRLFSEELSETPPFEPDAYPVAIDETNGEFVGLARVWRNPSGPRLGLVGVLRQYRNTMVVAALLRRALAAAATWGHSAVDTATSLDNRMVHRRLVSLGAESLGRTLQMVRR